MSDSGSPSDGGPYGLLDAALPPVEGAAGGEFDPLTLLDQIYPPWRDGPALPVDPLTQPMPTDPSQGSMDPEATTFPKEFADISGMSETMPSLAGFNFGVHNDALQAHNQLMKGGPLAQSFAGTGQSLPQQPASVGAPNSTGGAGDDQAGTGQLPPVAASLFAPPAVPFDQMTPQERSNLQSSSPEASNQADPVTAPFAPAKTPTLPAANPFDQPAVPFDQMSPQERNGLQSSSPDASNQADPTTAPFAPSKPLSPLPTPDQQAPQRADPSGVTAASLDAYFHSKHSPMEGQGANLIAYGQKYNLDPRFLVAIAGAETGFGNNITAGENNAFNVLYNGHQSSYSSWEKAINGVGKSLTNPGNGYDLSDVDSMYKTYCKGSDCENGKSNVKQFMREQGADPSALHYPGQ